MKTLLAAAVAVGLMGAMTPAQAQGISVHIGSGYHNGYGYDRYHRDRYWRSGYHHRHQVRYCSRWEWRHHGRTCRGWNWRWGY